MVTMLAGKPRLVCRAAARSANLSAGDPRLSGSPQPSRSPVRIGVVSPELRAVLAASANHDFALNRGGGSGDSTASLCVGGILKWPTRIDCKSIGLRPSVVRIHLPPPLSLGFCPWRRAMPRLGGASRFPPIPRPDTRATIRHSRRQARTRREFAGQPLEAASLMEETSRRRPTDAWLHPRSTSRTPPPPVFRGAGRRSRLHPRWRGDRPPDAAGRAARPWRRPSSGLPDRPS